MQHALHSPIALIPDDDELDTDPASVRASFVAALHLAEDRVGPTAQAAIVRLSEFFGRGGLEAVELFLAAEETVERRIKARAEVNAAFRKAVGA